MSLMWVIKTGSNFTLILSKINLALFLTCTFTYIYLSYIGIFFHWRLSSRHLMLPSQYWILSSPTNIMFILQTTISVDIHFYPDISCFTRDLTRVSTFFTNCCWIAQSSSIFRYSTSSRYLPPDGLLLQYPVLTSRPRGKCPSNNIPDFKYPALIIFRTRELKLP